MDGRQGSLPAVLAARCMGSCELQRANIQLEYGGSVCGARAGLVGLSSLMMYGSRIAMAAAKTDDGAIRCCCRSHST